MPDHWNPLRLTAEDRFPVPLATVLLAVFILGTLFVALHHEPWRDEADVWLAARDMPLTAAIPDWTAHQGSPALWLVILKLLTGLGFPYVSQTIANLAFAWAAAAIFLLCSPVSRLTKILFLASYYMAYEYSIIARTYALAVCLLFAALASRGRPVRFAVLIALLLNTSVHAAIFAALLVALDLVGDRLRPTAANRTRLLLSGAIVLGGGLAALWQLWPRAAGNPLAMRGFQLNAISALRDAFFPSSTSNVTVIASAIVLMLVALSIRRSPRALILLAGSVSALLALYSVVWFGGLRASGMILIAVIASIWMAAEIPDSSLSRAAALALNTTLIVSAVFAFRSASTDVRYAFSGSKEMAAFIDHRFDRYEIAAHNFYSAEALLPYLPQHRFWYIGLGKPGTYLEWNEAMRSGAQMPYEVAVAEAKAHFAHTGIPSLLLLNSRMPDPAAHGFRLIHATSVVVFRNLDERYWLYAPL